MVTEQPIRVWLAESGPAPHGWLLVRSPWTFVKLLIMNPREIGALSIEDRPLHRALVWLVAGGKALGELPGSAVPEIEVRA